MFKVIIAGCREFNDYELFKRKVNYLLSNQIGRKEVIVIVQGGASGTDSLAKRYAQENHFACEEYPALWNKYGRCAGPKRNEQMAKESGASALIAFWNGQSKGTKNMIENGKRYGLAIKVVRI